MAEIENGMELMIDCRIAAFSLCSVNAFFQNWLCCWLVSVPFGARTETSNNQQENKANFRYVCMKRAIKPNFSLGIEFRMPSLRQNIRHSEIND